MDQVTHDTYWMTHIKSYVKWRDKSNKSLNETYMVHVSQLEIKERANEKVTCGRMKTHT